MSQELCREWNWCNEAGRLKDIAARSLLRKLDHQGLIQLPAAVRSANNAFRNRPLTQLALDLEPVSIEGRLSDLQPLRINRATVTQIVVLLQQGAKQLHLLCLGDPVGENLKYLVYDRQARLLACLLYGAAAWRVASRDQFIGWDESARQCGLSRIANNMRFLILPDIRVPHLASHLLALISRRISSDWQAQYGHPIWLLETFVEQARFAGTCYKAANWMRVGHTTGRTRNHRTGAPLAPVKSVWLYPLHRSFQKWLVGMATMPDGPGS
ncbi:MAG: DUF4338 domain-containing protein [candidate division Zixibacteria bacterium]|nr:DUF4338 domain-containing protein [candidate division Zixibacteria bacterium]